MKTKFVEVTNGNFNWGKFLLGRFTPEEWAARSSVDGSMIGGRGWTRDHVLVLDLETGEGAIFKPAGYAKYDLDKHDIWVCPMYEPFLNWLYEQDLSDLDKLPSLVDFKQDEAPPAMHGYRREGANARLLETLEKVLDQAYDMCEGRASPEMVEARALVERLQPKKQKTR